MNKSEATKLVGMAVAAFPNMQERAMMPTINLWVTLMADIDYKAAEIALIKILSSAKYFPAPGEVISAVKSMRKSDVPPVELAWEEVCRGLNAYQRPNYSHPNIDETVRVMGYRQLCYSTNTVSDRARFFEIYSTICDRKKDREENERVFRLVYKGQDGSIIGTVDDLVKRITDGK